MLGGVSDLGGIQHFPPSNKKCIWSLIYGLKHDKIDSICYPGLFSLYSMVSNCRSSKCRLLIHLEFHSLSLKCCCCCVLGIGGSRENETNERIEISLNQNH